MKNIYFLLVSLIIFAACSTDKQVIKEKPKEMKQETVVKKLPAHINAYLKNVNAEGEIKFDMPSLDHTVDFELKIAANDSLYMLLSGPLGITVAKLYAEPRKFIFLNSFNGELFEGVPSMENFKTIANIPLEYKDFVAALKSKLPFEPSNYVLDRANDKQAVYYYRAKDFTDEIYTSIDNTKLYYYTRYGLNNSVIYKVIYENIQNISGANFAKKITIKFPSVNGVITIEYDKVQLNTSFKEPFTFKIPKNVKKQKVG
jgi:hypothetical protein